MSKLVVTESVSLDGVMQAPGGPNEDTDGGFAYGGWVAPHFDDEMGGLAVEGALRPDALLLGRRTYEIFAAHWPRVTGDDPIAAKLNAMPKHVASRTLEAVEWNNSTLIQGDVAEAVAELKEGPGGEIRVYGSGNLVQTLLANDLVDELVLWVFPVLLGEGKRLFGEGTRPAGLELADAKTSSTGVALHTYRRAGAVKTGSFELED
ncbi:MAG TPA: dihydrofolate reductase family protein [Miltoncostaeaceae bacterium]|nr:dihydrofolate reductase family protein [Miltoncostaeaceae bacterium]